MFEKCVWLGFHRYHILVPSCEDSMKGRKDKQLDTECSPNEAFGFTETSLRSSVAQYRPSLVFQKTGHGVITKLINIYQNLLSSYSLNTT